MNTNATGQNFYVGTLGPGTTVVSARAATVKRVFWGGTYVGTIAIYDSATAAGTAASNQVLSIGIPVLRYPESIEIDLHCNDGIIVTETGTPTHTVAWSTE